MFGGGAIGMHVVTESGLEISCAHTTEGRSGVSWMAVLGLSSLLMEDGRSASWVADERLLSRLIHEVGNVSSISESG